MIVPRVTKFGGTYSVLSRSPSVVTWKITSGQQTSVTVAIFWINQLSFKRFAAYIFGGSIAFPVP